MFEVLDYLCLISFESGVTNIAGDKAEGKTAEGKGAENQGLQGMKNKTMEDIINKWTGELDRCGEQFKVQANDIRRWDAILVENGDKVISPMASLPGISVCSVSLSVSSLLTPTRSSLHSFIASLHYYSSPDLQHTNIGDRLQNYTPQL